MYFCTLLNKFIYESGLNPGMATQFAFAAKLFTYYLDIECHSQSYTFYFDSVNFFKEFFIYMQNY